MAPVTVTYAIPVKGDKVVRSPKHGQTTLRSMPGIKRIFVDERSNSFFNKNGTELVKVVITARTKSSADACYNKAKEMVIKILEEEQKTTGITTETQKKTDRAYKGYYDVVEEADKVFRSPKHGQVTLREHHPNCRIKVCDRNNTGIVRVIITAPNKHEADACFREGDQMVKTLLANTPKEERANPLKELTVEEKFAEFVHQVKILIMIREMRGVDNHDDCPAVMELIKHRESQGITDHSELGRAWETKKPMVYLDDLLGYDVPVDDWGEHAEIFAQAKKDHPHLYVV